MHRRPARRAASSTWPTSARTRCSCTTRPAPTRAWRSCCRGSPVGPTSRRRSVCSGPSSRPSTAAEVTPAPASADGRRSGVARNGPPGDLGRRCLRSAAPTWDGPAASPASRLRPLSRGAEHQAGLGLGVEERGLRRHALAAVGGGLDLGDGGRAQQHAGLRVAACATAARTLSTPCWKREVVGGERGRGRRRAGSSRGRGRRPARRAAGRSSTSRSGSTRVRHPASTIAVGDGPIGGRRPDVLEPRVPARPTRSRSVGQAGEQPVDGVHGELVLDQLDDVGERGAGGARRRRRRPPARPGRRARSRSGGGRRR